MITREQLDILRHAIGQNTDGTSRGPRNSFSTDPGSRDHTRCMELVEAGMMRRDADFSGSPIIGGADFFTVTRAGRDEVTKHVEPAQKLTRSQRRYRQFLNVDGSETFGEWLRLRLYRTGDA